MNVEKLKATLRSKKITDTQYAQALGINISTLYRMYKSGEKMSVGQMHKTVELAALTNDEAIDIFLA